MTKLLSAETRTGPNVIFLVDDDVPTLIEGLELTYHETPKPFAMVKIPKHKRVALARLVMGDPPLHNVRFHNEDWLDCRRSNLYLEPKTDALEINAILAAILNNKEA